MTDCQTILEKMASIPPSESVKADVLDPIKRLCETHQLHFFVVLQSSQLPKQRFWTSSNQLYNLCGNLIFEFATYVNVLGDTPSSEKVGSYGPIKTGLSGTLSEDEPAKSESDDFVNFPTAKAPISHHGSSVPAAPNRSIDVDSSLKMEVDFGSSKELAIKLKNSEETTEESDGLDNESVLLPEEDLNDEDDGIDDDEAIEENDTEDGIILILNKDGHSTLFSKNLPTTTKNVSDATIVKDDTLPTMENGFIAPLVGVTASKTFQRPYALPKEGGQTELDEKTAPTSEQSTSSIEASSLQYPGPASSSGERFLEDDLHIRTFTDEETAPITEQLVSSSEACDLQSYPTSSGATSSSATPSGTVWRSHEFDRPLRESTVRRLFTAKLVFSVGPWSGLVSDLEYSPLLLAIIKTRNPYCAFSPASLCKYIMKDDLYHAEYLCRFDSCKLRAHLQIFGASNKVHLDFTRLGKLRSSATESASNRRSIQEDASLVPFISHEDARQVFVDQKHNLPGAISPEVMQNAFISKVVNKACSRIVEETDYVRVLRRLLVTVNPFCQFAVPRTECVVKNNREREGRKLDQRIRIINVRLGCEVESCPALVNVHVFNPSGDVTFSFLKGSYVKKPSRDNSEEQGMSDVIAILHIGKPRASDGRDGEPSGGNGKSRGGDCEPSDVIDKPLGRVGNRSDDDEDVVLELPSTIDLGRPLSMEILEEYFFPGLKIQGRRHFLDSNYLTFIKPLVAKYNPICTLVNKYSRILRGAKQFRIRLECKHCDFEAVCTIDGKTRHGILEMKNSLGVTRGEPIPPICYIRHSARLTTKKVQGLERKMICKRIREKAMGSAEVMETYGVTDRVAKKMRSESRNLRTDNPVHKYEQLLGQKIQQRIDEPMDQQHNELHSCETQERGKYEDQQDPLQTHSKAKDDEEGASQLGENRLIESKENDKVPSENVERNGARMDSTAVDDEFSKDCGDETSAIIGSPGDILVCAEDSIDSSETTGIAASNLKQPSSDRVRVTVSLKDTTTYDVVTICLKDTSTSDIEPSKRTIYLTLPYVIYHGSPISSKILREQLFPSANLSKIKSGRKPMTSLAFTLRIQRILTRYNSFCSLVRVKDHYVIHNAVIKVQFACRRTDCDVLMNCFVSTKTGWVKVVSRNTDISHRQNENVFVFHSSSMQHGRGVSFKGVLPSLPSPKAPTNGDTLKPSPPPPKTPLKGIMLPSHLSCDEPLPPHLRQLLKDPTRSDADVLWKELHECVLTLFKKYNPFCRLTPSPGKIPNNDEEFMLELKCLDHNCRFVANCFIHNLTGAIRYECVDASPSIVDTISSTKTDIGTNETNSHGEQRELTIGLQKMISSDCDLDPKETEMDAKKEVSKKEPHLMEVDAQIGGCNNVKNLVDSYADDRSVEIIEDQPHSGSESNIVIPEPDKFETNDERQEDKTDPLAVIPEPLIAIPDPKAVQAPQDGTHVEESYMDASRCRRTFSRPPRKAKQ